MARGYPDFFGSSVFPGYGSPLSVVTLAHVINAGDDYNAVDLACKGSTGPGFIMLADCVTIDDIAVRVTIDGVLHFLIGLDNFFNILSPIDRNHPLALTYLNREAQRVVLSIAPGIPFGQTFVITVGNGLGWPIEASVELLYYVVQ
jgi:hypothetical protein